MPDGRDGGMHVNSRLGRGHSCRARLVPIIRMAMPRKSSPADDSSLRIFVRRGALRRFDKLTRDAADLPVTIEWDRRTGDRRAESSAGEAERRNGDGERRHDPPFTWKVADFVVVGTPDGQAPAGSDGEPAEGNRRRKTDSKG